MTLTVVRETALAEASARAEGIRAAARERAERVLAVARADAAAVLAERRSAAERLADHEERAQLAEARRQARGAVLCAQRRVLAEARAAVRTAAGRLVGTRRYGEVLERLTGDARRRLGEGDAVRIVPSDGGFVALAGSRQIDCSLDALLDRCLQAMPVELERLWR